jgi:hypothetical protein
MDVSPFANVSCRSHSGNAHNPFAMLEALVVPQQYHHHHDPEQRAENERSRSDDDDDDEAFPGSQSASKDRAGRTSPLQEPHSHGSAPPSSPKKRKAPLEDYGISDALTGRRKDDCDDADSDSFVVPNGDAGPGDASCQLGDAASREVSDSRIATGDRPPRGKSVCGDNAAVYPPQQDLRQNELFDHTDTGPSRGAAAVQSIRRVPPPAPPAVLPPARSFLEDRRSASILQHSRRQLSKAAAARRASNKVSSGSVGSSSFSKAKAVVRASSRSIVGSRCVATD